MSNEPTGGCSSTKVLETLLGTAWIWSAPEVAEHLWSLYSASAAGRQSSAGPESDHLSMVSTTAAPRYENVERPLCECLGGWSLCNWVGKSLPSYLQAGSC